VGVAKLCKPLRPADLIAVLLRKNGGAVAGANSDKWPPSNQAGSEHVARKTGSEMNRMQFAVGSVGL